MSIPGQDFRQAARWKSVALYVGFALYFVSFFLPAVDQWKGWDCAWLALEYWHDDKVSPLVLFGGLVNPLGVLYLLVSALNAASKVRAYLAVAILFCIPLTWFALDRMNVQVKVGHFVWIAGVLLMLLPVISGITQLPGAKWLVVASLVVFSWLGIPKAISRTMHAPTERDDFYYVVAWNFHEPSVCRKIDPHAIGREDQRDDHDLTYMQSDCFRNLAAMLRAPSLCDNIRSAGIDRVVGSLIAKWNCRRQRYTWGTASPADGQSFVKMMQAVGYSEERLSGLINQRDPGNSIHRGKPRGEDYWDYFWYLASYDKTSARSDFLTRVMELK